MLGLSMLLTNDQHMMAHNTVKLTQGVCRLAHSASWTETLGKLRQCTQQT